MRGSPELKVAMAVLVVLTVLTLRLGWEATVGETTQLSKVQGVNTSYAIPGLPNLPNLPDVDVPNVPDVDVPNRNDRNRNDRSGNGSSPGVPNPNGPNPNDRNDGNDSTSSPNLGVDCSTGVRNVPVVPYSSGDGDGDGIACEDVGLTRFGGHFLARPPQPPSL